MSDEPRGSTQSGDGGDNIGRGGDRKRRRGDSDSEGDDERINDRRKVGKNDESGLVADVQRVPRDIDNSPGVTALLADLEEDNKSIREELVKHFELACGDIIRDAYETCQTSFGSYVSDVFACNSEQHATEICDLLSRESQRYRRAILIICKHDTHVHVVHDCAGNSCRDAFIKKAESQSILRGAISKRTFISSKNYEDWRNILFYFNANERETTRLVVAGRDVKIHDRLKDLPKVRYGEIHGRGQGSLAICSEENQNYSFGRAAAFNDGTSFQGAVRAKRAAKSVHAGVHGQILFLLKSLAPCPLSHITALPQYNLNPKFRFKRNSDYELSNIIDTFSCELLGYNTDDFHFMYEESLKNGVDPVFGAGPLPPSQIYYDIPTSVDILEKYLLFQFDEDHDKAKDFLVVVVGVCDRKYPRMNCVLIFSPPASGKNFLFDHIGAFYLVKGMISGYVNKNNEFAFQEMVNKRIFFWNEPNYSPEKIELLKNVTAGDFFSVRVKCKADCAVFKTPVFMFTNNKLSIMSHNAFKTRMFQFEFKEATYLKEYKKLPNPMAWWYLLKRFGINTS